jgi:CheY-like chemotaxis protein
MSYESRAHRREIVPTSGLGLHGASTFLHRPHILIVEDHEAVRDVISRTLHKIGVVTIEAASVAECRGLLGSAMIDAAILDIALPGGGNGLELGELIRARCPLMPIIYISGLTEQELPGKLPRDPLTRFIRKPFGARVVIDFVTNLLAQPLGGMDMSPF